MYAKEFNKLIKEICKEKNIKVDTMSFEYILRLQKEQKEFYIIGYKFNLNTHSSTAIARDKYATYEILKSKNIPIIEHKIIFSEQLKGGKCTEENLKASKEYFHKNKNKMVLKPNKGKEGINVYFCDKEDKIKSIINKIFKEDNAVVLNPFYNIKNEYRTIYLNGECLITYGKNIPYLIGDGKSNIEDLLMKEMKLNIKDIREENIKEVNGRNKTEAIIIEMIAMLFLIIYLVVSFITMAWHVTWILWLVFALVELIVKLIFDLKGEKNEK